jgi:hypothetical protein
MTTLTGQLRYVKVYAIYYVPRETPPSASHLLKDSDLGTESHGQEYRIEKG